MMFWLIWLAVNLICGIFAYALTLGYFTEKWPWQNHWKFAAFMGFLGIGGLLVALVKGRPYYLQWRPCSYDERLASFLGEYYPCTEEDFKRVCSGSP